MSEEDRIFTKAVHAGDEPGAHLGALSVPIYQAAVFSFPDAEQGSSIHEGKQAGYFYGRMGNPTQAVVERAMSEIEGGEAALALSSGMAAISATLFTLLRPGDHVVAPESLYATTNTLFDEMLVPFGIDVTYVDATDSNSFAAAVRPQTKLFYMESPANPTLKLTDIESVVAIAQSHEVTTVVDNTFATPFNQRPLSYGVDVVVHSATKYLGGHGDLTAGVIVGRQDIIDRARWHTNKILGGVVAPHTAWLVLRGLKTFALRMERHNDNALQVAQFLERHPKVDRVHYPGLISHPQYQLARRQMTGYGGMLAFEVGGIEEGKRLVNSVKLCALAVSLGDVATLIQHSASMTHASVPRDRRLAVGIADGLLRLSVGIERTEDIVDDLTAALGNV